MISMLSRLFLFKKGNAFDVTFHESDHSVVIAAQEATCALQGVLQVKDVHRGRIAHYSIAFLLGKENVGRVVTAASAAPLSRPMSIAGEEPNVTICT